MCMIDYGSWHGNGPYRGPAYPGKHRPIRAAVPPPHLYPCRAVLLSKEGKLVRAVRRSICSQRSRDEGHWNRLEPWGHFPGFRGGEPAFRPPYTEPVWKGEARCSRAGSKNDLTLAYSYRTAGLSRCDLGRLESFRNSLERLSGGRQDRKSVV